MSAHRLAREIGEAALLTSEFPARQAKTKHTDLLIETAKHIERLQARRRKLRRELREVEREIRAERRTLRALCVEVGRGE